ncbi:MAG: deoxyribonuclease IV [Candidatus Cloacimonetes bacterium]|nr:deoxyribonuclease IV [Candidatus Cloacimonadota bacterium]
MNLGAHISIANGIELIFERAKQVTANAIQIFVTNQNQWSTRQPKPQELESFFQLREEYKPFSIMAHSRYLINLCSNDPEKEEKSIRAFYEELQLCELFKIPYLVIHPGSYLDQTEEWGLNRIISNIDLTIDRFKDLKTVILLETTAGQGTNLGYKFEQLAYLMKNSRFQENLAVCFDTCHTFAAGYDLKDKYDVVFTEFENAIGIDKLKAFHLNDTKKGLAARVDRHEHIGKGELGLEPFRKLMNDNRFKKIPMILETPKGDNDEMDIVNLQTLRSLRTGV